MKKILYAAGTIGHINNFHLPYIEKLRSEGHAVTVMADGAGADIDMPFVKRMLSPKNLLCSIKIRGILMREKFDTVILNTTLAAFDVRFLMPMRKRPKVINFVHGYMFSPKPKGIKGRLFLLAERLLSKKTDHIMVMNAEDYGIALGYRLCKGEIKMTRGMGARIKEGAALPVGLLCERQADTKKYIICFVGELSQKKNQRMLIYALREIKAVIPNAVLWLIGDGGIREELTALADRLGLSGAVRFLGHRQNPCDYIRKSDLYISASKKEGLPFNILEALGCGKTVIVSDVKGHRDIIESEKYGFLFKPDDQDELVSLIKKAFAGEISVNPEDARKRFEEFSFDTVFPETYGIMKELIDGDSNP